MKQIKVRTTNFQIFSPLETWSKDGIALLTGDTSIFTLAHQWMAHLVRLETQVYVIDCAIRFRVFTIADYLHSYAISPEKGLQNIKIRRDFTPYQLLTTINELRNLQTPYIYFLLNPVKQFLDGDVGEDEGYFLLKLMVRKLLTLQQLHKPVILVEKPGYKHFTFMKIFPKMLQTANTVWTANITSQDGKNTLSISTGIQARKTLQTKMEG